MKPLDLVSASPWQRVVFTTYALSLSFFEAAILDALTRGGGRDPLIFADTDGVFDALGERGAQYAGTAYRIEPVASTRGVFHPKLSVFTAAQDCHLLVGSGNLTFGGWGNNMELVEHLHPSFASTAFLDAADFFETLAIADHVRMGASTACEEIGAMLRRAGSVGSQPQIRLVHGLVRPIGEQLAEFADDLGGATHLTIVSPYYDRSGHGVQRLADALKCDDVRGHVHASGAARGAAGLNWPARLPLLKPVSVDAEFGDDKRPLHAKAFEIRCKRGRLLVSGSANATSAALFGGNIEASIVRIQRGRTSHWINRRVAAPSVTAVQITGEPDETHRDGVLRAELEGNRIFGSIITAFPHGPARMFAVKGTEALDLGEVLIGMNGTFAAVIAAAKETGIGVGRLVLRIECGETAAEGFVAVEAAFTIARTAGPVAHNLLALLTGTETPVDIAAILCWFRDDPKRLLTGPAKFSGGTPAATESGQPKFVPLTSLQWGKETESSGASPSERGSDWERAFALIRTAFSQNRGPWRLADEIEDEENDGTEVERRIARRQKSERKAMDAFAELLGPMLTAQGGGAAFALSMAHYLADRIRPEPHRVLNWLQQIIESDEVIASKDIDLVTASQLLYASSQRPDAATRARRYLLRRGMDPTTVEIDGRAIPAFVAIVHPTWDAAEFGLRVRAVSTAGEEIRSYLAAARGTEQRRSYPGLEQTPHWPQLARALVDGEVFDKIWVIDEFKGACTRCSTHLPSAVAEDLRLHGVARCCRLLLCSEI